MDMIRIIEDGKRKNLWSMPPEFIMTVARMDDDLSKDGINVAEVIITTDKKGKKDVEINWEYKFDSKYY